MFKHNTGSSIWWRTTQGTSVIDALEDLLSLLVALNNNALEAFSTSPTNLARSDQKSGV